MEVSNNSDTDPCAWVGVVDKLGKTVKVRIKLIYCGKVLQCASLTNSHMHVVFSIFTLTASNMPMPTTALLGCSVQVKYPFHDSPDEWIKVGSCLFRSQTVACANATKLLRLHPEHQLGSSAHGTAHRYLEQHDASCPCFVQIQDSIHATTKLTVPCI